jgi:signal transduction histidine kinase
VRAQVHIFANRLASRVSRAQAAERIAAELGHDAFLVLLHDPGINALRPAPGFPQTLPGGPAWRAFLRSLPPQGASTTELPFPDPDVLKPAHVFVQGQTVLLFIGGELRLPIEAFGDVPLLGQLLAAEAEIDANAGLVEAANEATERATNLTRSLDQARTELAANARELTAALSHSDRLNDELKRLNETLESRVAEEIRERMQAEEALRQAQKMEAIGQLTGGVAHDFNNLLTVIMGGLDSIRRELDGSAEPDLARIRRLQAMAFQGAERASNLTARLLAFARRQPLDPKAVDLNKLVLGLSDLLQRTLGETIALEAVSSPGLWLAHADPAELESAIINLAINARDAMPDGGKLTIETANANLGEDYVEALMEPVPPGQYAMIAVTDTGHGMEKDTLDRVFEPFFTTKQVGKGTGLGLSQVYGFVRQSGGHIRIYSEPGSGTTVKLYLPRESSNVVAETEDQPVRAVADGGNETILLVEDHEGLRGYSSGVLRELGYDVLEASDSDEALKILRDTSDVQLLFTDVVLPGLNGRQLADEAALLHPNIKVLYTTGYTRNAIVHNGRLDRGVSLITKPFTFEALARKVRQILDA